MSQDRLFSVEGQVTLVSGGSRGIGKALAHGFAERGAKVIITGRDQETLAQTAKEIGHGAEFAICDVANDDEIERLVSETVARHGRIDTLLNVAGVNRRKAAETLTAEDIDFVMNINFRGALLLSLAVGKQMLKQQSGAQIQIASLNNVSPLKWVLPYAASKAAIGHMTRSLALEWGDRGVRVNAIAPGFILTDLTRKLWSSPVMQAWGAANTPQKRLGTPEDMVGTAVFLASQASAFLTGQVIVVDGGITAGTSWPISEAQ